MGVNFSPGSAILQQSHLIHSDLSFLRYKEGTETHLPDRALVKNKWHTVHNTDLVKGQVCSSNRSAFVGNYNSHLSAIF